MKREYNLFSYVIMIKQLLALQFNYLTIVTKVVTLKADQREADTTGGVHGFREKPATCYFRARSTVNTAGHCCGFLFLLTRVIILCVFTAE